MQNSYGCYGVTSFTLPSVHTAVTTLTLPTQQFTSFTPPTVQLLPALLNTQQTVLYTVQLLPALLNTQQTVLYSVQLLPALLNTQQTVLYSCYQPYLL